MSIYDDPDITLEELTIELGYLIRDIALIGIKSLNREFREFREFRKFQKETESKDSPIDCDEWS